MATLTPLADFTPVPRVNIAMVAADLPVGTTSVSLFKVVGGRTISVRGAVLRAFVTSLTLQDMEAPFGVATNYLAEGFNSLGASLGRVSLGTTTLDVTDSVIQQPLDPSLSAKVTRLQALGSELHRKVRGELVTPEGRVRPTLIAEGPRQGLSELDLDFLVEPAGADTLIASLGTEDKPQLPVWLIRTPPPQRLPRLLYVFVPDLVEVPYPNNGVVRLQAQVDEIEPPAPGLVTPPLSYADLDAAYATYALRDAAYASYAAMDSDWSLAGLVP